MPQQNLLVLIAVGAIALVYLLVGGIRLYRGSKAVRYRRKRRAGFRTMKSNAGRIRDRARRMRRPDV